MNVENRTIFEGDNLHILRGLDSETIDLIYLDPSFNSNKTYEAPIGSEAAGASFKDTWTLSDMDNAWHGELAEREPALYAAISAAKYTRQIYEGVSDYDGYSDVRDATRTKTDRQHLLALRSDSGSLFEVDNGYGVWCE